MTLGSQQAHHQTAFFTCCCQRLVGEASALPGVALVAPGLCGKPLVQQHLDSVPKGPGVSDPEGVTGECCPVLVTQLTMQA